MDRDEIELEYMEQELEERLTQREALFLGLPSERERSDTDGGASAFLLGTLD